MDLNPVDLIPVDSNPVCTKLFYTVDSFILGIIPVECFAICIPQNGLRNLNQGQIRLRESAHLQIKICKQSLSFLPNEVTIRLSAHYGVKSIDFTP